KYASQPDEVATEHLHAPVVSVNEQVAIMTRRVQEAGQLTFNQLVADARTTMVVVVRFLGLLTVYWDQRIGWGRDGTLSEMPLYCLNPACLVATSRNCLPS